VTSPAIDNEFQIQTMILNLVGSENIMVCRRCIAAYGGSMQKIEGQELKDLLVAMHEKER